MENTFFKAEIETTESWVIKRPRYFVRSFCAQCNREVSLLIPEEAARLTCLDLSNFYMLMERDCFHVYHFGETMQTFVCLNSLCSI